MTHTRQDFQVSSKETETWIDIKNWHRVKVNGFILQPPGTTFGRVVERRNALIFEDERDAVVFKLSLK